MQKDFDAWNTLKKVLNDKHNKIVTPKEREIYWVSIGENIGFEQNGKSEIFSRPVLVLKKFSKRLFFGIPLSTQIKKGDFFYSFEFGSTLQNALLVQGRTFDAKRLENRMGMISEKDFENIKERYIKLLRHT